MIINMTLKGSAEFQIKMQRLMRDMGASDRRGLYKALGLTAHGWMVENMKKGRGLLKRGRWKRLSPSVEGYNVFSRWSGRDSYNGLLAAKNVFIGVK